MFLLLLSLKWRSFSFNILFGERSSKCMECLPTRTYARIWKLLIRKYFFVDFLHDFNESARPIFARKATISNPCLLWQQKAKFTLYHVIQSRGIIILIAPRAFYFGFNLGCDIASAVNCADSPWLPWAQITAKIRTSDQITMQVALPVKRICGAVFVPQSIYFRRCSIEIMIQSLLISQESDLIVITIMWT